MGSARALRRRNGESSAGSLFAQRYEFVGIVIVNGTMHEETYAQWWGWEYVDHWEGHAAAFVRALRVAKDDPTLFEYFEKVATSRKFKQLSGRN